MAHAWWRGTAGERAGEAGGAWWCGDWAQLEAGAAPVPAFDASLGVDLEQQEKPSFVKNDLFKGF